MTKEKDVVVFSEEDKNVVQTVIAKKKMPEVEDGSSEDDSLFDSTAEDVTPTADLQEYVVVNPPEILPFGDPVFNKLAVDFLNAFKKFTIHYSFWAEKKFDMTSFGLKNAVRDTIYDMQWILKQMSELCPKKLVRKSDGAVEFIPDSYYIQLYNAIMPIDGRGLFSGDKRERERVVFVLEQQRFLFENMSLMSKDTAKNK